MGTGRFAFIDLAKSICIFLMVVGHYFPQNHLLLTYIYSFHMPVLFIISGYLYRPHSWYKTVISFFVPILFFSLVNLSVKIILGEIVIGTIQPTEIFFRIFHYRYGLGETLFTGDWFLWALIGLRFLFGDIPCLHILKKYYIPIAIICVVYMTFEKYLVNIDVIFRGYLIGRMIPSMVFFCFGLYLREINWQPQVIQRKYMIVLVLLAFILPLQGECSIVANEYGLSYVVFSLNAILSSALLLILSNKIPSSKFIETISKGTLVVLGTHTPILHVLKCFLPNWCSITFPFITMVICYYIIILCERYCPILMGKWKQPKNNI